MTTDDPRDRALDRLLGRRPDAAASADCLDAETIAAWADGGLDAPTLARAEAHMSGCARCQAVMATLVQMPAEEGPSIEAAERQRRPWWHIDIRWLVPLASAATAVLVWMLVPQRAPEPRRPEQFKAESSIKATDAVERPAEPTPPASAAPSTPAATEEGKAAGLERDLAARQEAEGRRARRESANPTTAKEQPAETADLLTKRVAPAAPLAESIAPAPPPSANAAATAERQERQNAPAAPAASGFSADADAARGRLGAASLAMTIVSRDPAVRWRTRGDAIVERSTDGGQNWQQTDTQATARLVAGSSPSASVCWVVGSGGAVLLTTDARTWHRVASPTSDDLVAVTATDDRTAVVRSASGQSFRTIDAGVTWTSF